MTRATSCIAPDESGNVDPMLQFVPEELLNLANPQTDIPRIAKDARLTRQIDERVGHIPTVHDLHRGDARRRLLDLPSASINLVLTSPPYWTLKEYRRSEAQLGFIADYEKFLVELDRVWRECWRVL